MGSVRQKSPRAQEVVLISLIGAAAVVFFWEAIVAGSCHFPWDIVDQMYPFQRFARKRHLVDTYKLTEQATKHLYRDFTYNKLLITDQVT